MKSGVITLSHVENINSKYPRHLRHLASGQYLSQVAYYLAKQAKLPKTITILNEDGLYKKYLISRIDLKPGLYGYILLPEDRNSGDVKVIWRGTDPTDAHSIEINLEEGGPAVQSFYQEKANIFDHFFDAIMNHYPNKPPLTLQIAGHSQGGALSQLFATHLLIERYHSHDYDHINALHLTTLNSPGVSKGIADLANDYAKKQSEINKPISIIANFGLVKGDIIPSFGLDTIFAKLSPEHAIVNVVTIFNQFNDYWKQDLYLKDGLQLKEIMGVLKNTLTGLLGAHSPHNYFAPVDSSGKIFVSDKCSHKSNTKPEDISAIHAELLFNKTCKLQKTLYFMQKLITEFDIIGITPLASGILHYFSKPSSGIDYKMGQNGVLYQPTRQIKHH